MREFISCAVNSEAGAVISKIQPVYCIFAVDDMCFVPSMFETLTKDLFEDYSRSIQWRVANG